MFSLLYLMLNLESTAQCTVVTFHFLVVAQALHTVHDAYIALRKSLATYSVDYVHVRAVQFLLRDGCNAFTDTAGDMTSDWDYVYAKICKSADQIVLLIYIIY